VFRRAGYAFIVVFALALLAFWKSYVTRPSSFGDPYTHVHAALMVAWFAILIAQPFLIRREHRAAHRLLGRISFALVPLLAASILLLAHARIRAIGPLGADARFFFLPFGMTVLLVVPWALAVKHRRTVALHARYMICTVFAVVDPVLGRILYFYFPPLPSQDHATLASYLVTAGLLAALYTRERSPRPRPFAVMLVLATVIYGVFATFARTDTWRVFVEWYGTLPLTS
jgi:hypothetical protein